MTENIEELIEEAREWCKDRRGGYQEYPGGPLIEYDGIDMVKRLAEHISEYHAERSGA